MLSRCLGRRFLTAGLVTSGAATATLAASFPLPPPPDPSVPPSPTPSAARTPVPATQAPPSLPPTTSESGVVPVASDLAAISPPLRVLVTGFNDWHELGTPPNVWRCRDNPSCRLIVGDACMSPPVARNGSLPQLLRTKRPGIQWNFQTLPVAWFTASGLDLMGYDVVVHLGLGVYHCHDKLILENGAFNGRRGQDCYKLEGGHTIEAGAAQALQHARMSTNVTRFQDRKVGDFRVEVAPARMRNTYICNETHWRGLKALEAAERQQETWQREVGQTGDAEGPAACPARLRGVYFLHIPVPEKHQFADEAERMGYLKGFDVTGTADYGPLSAAVAGVICDLVDMD